MTTLIKTYGETEILHALSTFLHKAVPDRRFSLFPHTRVNVYKRVTFTLRSIQRLDPKVNDAVRAIPAASRRGRVPAQLAHFDTALIHYSVDGQETGVRGDLFGH